MISTERIAEIEKHARMAARIAYRELFEAKIPLAQVHEPLCAEDWMKIPKGLDGSLLDLIEGTEYMNLLCKQVSEDYDKLRVTPTVQNSEYDYFNDAWRGVEDQILNVVVDVLNKED